MNDKPTSKKKKLKLVLFSLGFFALILGLIFELLLYVIHYPSAHERMKSFSFEKAKWWKQDSAVGPVYVANQVNKEDSVNFNTAGAGWYYDRLKIVNEQGYHDRKNFTPVNAGSDTTKILFVGDSFTWGASSDIDSSYVETFERDVNGITPNIVWNTGIPATGTNHALWVTQKFLPLQKSNFVILGFYVGNDFTDNLTPFDRILFTKNSSSYNLYDYGSDLKPFAITQREVFKKVTGYFPPEELNIFQKAFSHSRLLTFISDNWKKLGNRLNGTKKKVVEAEYNNTKEYLKQLDAYVKANNAHLIAFIIPDKGDVKTKSQAYLNAVKVMQETGVDYCECINELADKNYLQAKADQHWNNSGHGIAGHVLSAYFKKQLKPAAPAKAE